MTLPQLVAGQYAVDLAAPLPGAGGGLDAFAVNDRNGARTGMMAVLSRPFAPPRAAALIALAAGPIEHLLSPVAHGIAVGPGGTPGWFVVCPAPPGPALWPNGATGVAPWTERDLLQHFLRPAAMALDRLNSRHLTHRAIRPDNIFRGPAGEAAVLGAAWSAPPASAQPTVFEPPYSATCQNFGRGEGNIADDIYALGVTLLCLATGRLPLAGLDAGEIISRKLDLGSFVALAGTARLPSAVADLLTSMLAEDPEHRPTPALLIDPATARARRVAARPPRRAQKSLEIGTASVWNARTLANAIGRAPEQGARLLRLGVVDSWLRRQLGDGGLAVRLDELVRQRALDAEKTDVVADMALVARAVALLDPLAPLWWRGVALWPDGVGAMLAEFDRPGAAAPLVDGMREVVDGEIIPLWAGLRPERCDVTSLRLDAATHRQILRQRGWGGGMTTLRYFLNPLLACASPLLAGNTVVRKGDLLPALDAVGALPEGRRQAPLDAEIGAFLAARQEPAVQQDLLRLATLRAPAREAGAIQLRIFAGLQQRLQAPALPHLAAWLADLAAPAIAVWRSRHRRERIAAGLPIFVRAGKLTAMLQLLEDRPSQAADTLEAQAAVQAVQAIDAELTQLQRDAPMRRDYAARIGHEIATAAAITGLTISAVLLVLR